MNCSQKSRRIFVQTAFALTCLLSAAAPTFAEEGARPTTEKWRPKDGVYASRGANFSDRCLDFGDTIVEFAEKRIGGGEENCKIIRLRDTGPGAITLDVTCTDIDKETPGREVMSMKKIDEQTIFVRRTENGKFNRASGETVSYCPDEAQRMYMDSKKKR